jgi:hypothetical protein
MAYTDIDKPSDYFETVLYAGNGGTQSITSLDFQPDWCWFKARNNTDTHAVFDSVRGATKRLIPNGTNAEGTQSNGITSFNSNGFTSGDANITNGGSSRTYASWNWKAGTSFTNDASGTGIGSIDSAGSVNTDAGFSIISYTGTGSAATVAHGLGSAPRMIIIKDRSNARNWGVYHQSMGNLDAIYLDLTNAKGGNSSAFWNSTSPTSSVFSINTRNEVNASSANMIAYCFAEKKGYSKFGSYTGNGNANGTFVYTGFKPAWVMIKDTTNASTNWVIYDNKRDIDNPAIIRLFPNDSLAEVSNAGVYDIDFLSNGFKIRTTNNNFNASGATMIYACFAENPFTTSTGVCATAR